MEDNTIKYLPNNNKQPDLQTEDLDNIIYIIQGKIGLEATHDKIIIVLDQFKSGYECKTCGGEGIEPRCSCGDGKNRLGGLCKLCEGDPDKYAGKECRVCKGIGSTIVLPESAKQLPTSGRIVSCGPECRVRKVGERVLFGAHTGYFLPFKGNQKLRVMREFEPLCKIYSIEHNVSMGDFMSIEDSIDK